MNILRSTYSADSRSFPAAARSRSNTGGFRFFLLSALVIAQLPVAGPAFAATTATIQLSPAGSGDYVLQGISLEQAAALELTIIYDTAGLANPRVDQGSLLAGAMAAINVNVPGSIRMAFIRVTPVSGSGPLANIHFTLTGTGQGRVLAMSAKLATLDGRPLPVSTQVVNTPDQTQTDSAPAPPEPSGSGATRSPEQTAPPVRTFLVPLIAAPGEQPATNQTTTADQGTTDRTLTTMAQTPTAPARDASKQSPPDRAASDAGSPSFAKKVYTTQSVLDRFMAFTGKRTPENLTALFEQEQAIGFRQEPSVVLTDGKQKAVLRFIASSDRKTADIALLGASLLSLKADTDYSNTWIAEVMPATGAVRATISITQSSFLMVVPLAVAPKVDIDLDQSGSVTEEDFKLFLAEKGTLKEPRFDLNKDGKRDAMDDYIFTANYLAKPKPDRAAKAA